MEAIYLLIPITVILLIVAVAIFFWAVNSDQYSDLDKEAHRILFDKESTEKVNNKTKVKTNPKEKVKKKAQEESQKDGS